MPSFCQDSYSRCKQGCKHIFDEKSNFQLIFSPFPDTCDKHWPKSLTFVTYGQKKCYSHLTLPKCFGYYIGQNLTAVIPDGLTVPEQEQVAVWRIMRGVLPICQRCARIILIPDIWVADSQLFYSLLAFPLRFYPLKPFATVVHPGRCNLDILFCSKGRSSIEQDKEDELHRGDVVRVSDGCVKL